MGGAGGLAVQLTVGFFSENVESLPLHWCRDIV